MSIKRRAFLKFLGLTASLPAISPLVAKCVQEPSTPTNTSDGVSPQDNDLISNIMRRTWLKSPAHKIDYVAMSNAGEMAAHEGVV
jgi:hypothetical protein